MSIPSFSFPGIRSQQAPSVSFKANHANPVRFGNEQTDEPLEWQIEAEQLVAWLKERSQPEASPFQKLFAGISAVLGPEENWLPSHITPTSTEPFSVLDSFLDSGTDEARLLSDQIVDYFASISDNDDPAASNQAQRKKRHYYSAFTLAPEVMQIAYESNGKKAANYLAVSYFKAAVSETGGEWRIENPEALIRAFQWDAVAQRNNQKQLSIFDEKDPHPAMERAAILTLLSEDEIAKIQNAQQAWLRKFPQIA